jgi:uncharacterized protein YwqG
MNTLTNIPPELEPFRKQIEQTVVPFIKIVPNPAASIIKPWQSKIGGFPYLPLHTEFPTDNEGRELFFLAQINFSELPAFPSFLQTGLLQFYIHDDCAYGCNYLDKKDQNRFRILFLTEIDKDRNRYQKDFSWLRDYGDTPIDGQREIPLKFELSEEAVPLSDHRVVRFLGESFFDQFAERKWEIMERYSVAIHSDGHKMGGYAHFTQQDPRYLEGDMELLLQIDSDPEIGCMWGDMGLGNFFINKADLLQRNFSRVLYSWDCY